MDVGGRTESQQGPIKETQQGETKTQTELKNKVVVAFEMLINSLYKDDLLTFVTPDAQSSSLGSLFTNTHVASIWL